MRVEGWDLFIGCLVMALKYEFFRTITTHLFLHYRRFTRLRDRELEKEFCHFRSLE
jgi:hypothetical protein